MSGLRDNLEEWALARGSEVAAVVAEREVAGRHAIRTRRRRRILATATTAIVAAVAVVTVASALPGVNDAPPAKELSRHLSELVCGDPWLAESGTTAYMSDADYYFDPPQGGWVLTDDNGDTHSDFTGFTAGLGSVSWQGEQDLRGHTIVRARTVAVKLGTVVGVTEDQYARIRDEGGASLNVNAPRPGACGDTAPGNSSGKVTYHLVLQLSRLGDGGGPLATIVDPGGPLTVAIDGVEAYLEEQATPPAEPLAPKGDTYQAFVVQQPTEATCEPYQELMASGEPKATSMTYRVTIPGIRAVDSGLWDGDPVAIIPGADVDAWYVGLPTAVTSERFGAGNPLESLSWVTGPGGTMTIPAGELGLIHTNDDAPVTDVNAGCVYTLPGPTPSGAVYLIIDGVDVAAIDAAYPGADYTLEGMQTWVYLGQAS